MTALYLNQPISSSFTLQTLHQGPVTVASDAAVSGRIITTLPIGEEVIVSPDNTAPLVLTVIDLGGQRVFSSPLAPSVFRLTTNQGQLTFVLGDDASISITDPTSNDIIFADLAYTIRGTCSTGATVAVTVNGISVGAATVLGSTWSRSWTPIGADEGVVSIVATQTLSGVPTPSTPVTPLVLADVVFAIDSSKTASYTASGSNLTSLVNLKSGAAMATIVGAPKVLTDPLTGFNYFDFDGASKVQGTEAAVLTARNGTNKPFTFFCVHKRKNDQTLGGTWLGFGDGASTSNNWGALVISNEYFIRTSGSVALQDYFGYRTAGTGMQAVSIRSADGLTYSLSLNNKAELNVTHTTAGVVTSNRFAVGCIPQNTNDLMLNGRVYQEIYCSTSKSGAIRTQVFNRLATKWAAPQLVYYGDSLTQIDLNAPLGGWRYRVAQWCAANGVKVDNPGLILSGAGYPRDLWQDGIGGYTVQDVAARLAAILGPSLYETDAQLCFIWAGINNVGSGTAAAGLAALPALLNNAQAAIQANRPAARICLLNLIPCAGFEAGVAAWNAALPAIISTFNAAHPSNQILFVDANQAVGGPTLNPAYYVGDGVHLNELGNEVLTNNGILPAVGFYLGSL